MQPHITQGSLCAAVFIRPTIQPQWITIPCDKAIAGASFICELQSNYGTSRLKKRTIFRANRDCPSKTINIESSCLHVVNVLSEIPYNVEKVCTDIDLSVFSLPVFLFLPQQSLVRLSQGDFFVLELLISMTHRWKIRSVQNLE